jgi:hypothetical protein
MSFKANHLLEKRPYSQNLGKNAADVLAGLADAFVLILAEHFEDRATSTFEL